MNTLKHLFTLLTLLALFQSCQEITYILPSKPFQIESVVMYASGFNRLAGIAFDKDGNLLVANFLNPGIISRVSPAGVVDTFAFGADRAVAQIAIDSYGFVYGTYQDGTVKRVTSLGGMLTTFVSGQLNPAGVAFDRFGNLYVANYNDNTVRVYSPSGALVNTISTGISGPVGITFDDEGNLYVANAGNNTIFRIDTNGNGSIFTSISKPHSLAWDGHGNLFVSLSDGYTGYGVVVVSQDKTLFQLQHNFFHAIGLAFDDSGNLFVANYDAGFISKVSFR